MDERTRRIVRAAIELAEKGGFEGVRLRDVAADAEVAIGTLYRRFGSKEALLLAALELQVEAHEKVLAREPARGESAVERIGDLFARTTQAMCSRPSLARALLRSVLAGGPELGAQVAAFHGRIEGLILTALRDDEGEVRCPEREQRLAQALLRVWFASLSGWAGGLHDIETVIGETSSAAELMLEGAR